MDRMEKLMAYLKDQPKDPFLRHALALEYQKAGKTQDAIATWEQVLTEVPDYVGSYYHLAGALAQVNRTSDAIEWYEKGLALAKKIGDNHAWNELRAAYDDLMDS
ncbi:MAG: tetratricopeptide repeat protein [Sediminibacterium sp.]